MQSALKMLYPAQCLTCDALVEDQGVLCGTCWRDTPFIRGVICADCGLPLPGQAIGAEHCDDCMTMARPWDGGRAALLYKDVGRKLVLALKHGDRQDLIPPASHWMAEAGADVLMGDPLLVPVPLHWTRLFRRRYNQAALLANGLARETGLATLPDVLLRPRRTVAQDGMTVSDRFRNLAGQIIAHPKRGLRLAGRKVVLIDDVMTSGATLAAAAEAVWQAGAAQVSTLVLARVAKDT